MPREIFTTFTVSLTVSEYLRLRAVKGLTVAPPLSELTRHARELILIGCSVLEERSTDAGEVRS